jgi:hypothetical protein
MSLPSQISRKRPVTQSRRADWSARRKSCLVDPGGPDVIGCRDEAEVRVSLIRVDGTLFANTVIGDADRRYG